MKVRFLLAATLLAATPATAQNYAMQPGDYTEVTMIEVLPGHDYDYDQFLATQYRKTQDYAKAQGWIKDYKILTNVYGREGEPDVYIMTTFANIPDNAEAKRREDAFRKFMAQSDQQLAQASGNRGAFRKVLGRMLLQEIK